MNQSSSPHSATPCLLWRGEGAHFPLTPHYSGFLAFFINAGVWVAKGYPVQPRTPASEKVTSCRPRAHSTWDSTSQLLYEPRFQKREDTVAKLRFESMRNLKKAVVGWSLMNSDVDMVVNYLEGRSWRSFIEHTEIFDFIPRVMEKPQKVLSKKSAKYISKR